VPATRLALGACALLLTAGLWGSNHVVARAIHEMVPLPALVFWRWAIALTILTPAAWWEIKRYREPLLRQSWDIAIGGTIGVGVFSYLLIGGAYQSLALEVGIINATTPVWVAILAWVYGQSRTGWEGWIGLLLALVGTVTILAKGSASTLGALDIRLGNLWSLLGAIAFAWFSLRVRTWSREIGPLSLTAATAWAGLIGVMLPVYLISLLFGGPLLVHEGSDLPYALSATAYVALGPTLLGNVGYLYGVSALGPERAAAFIYLSPIFSAILSVIWLGETLQSFHFAGFSMIFSGLLLVNDDQRRVAQVRSGANK